MAVLDKYAPMKKKVIRGNNAPFMSKRLKRSCIGQNLKINLTKIPLRKTENCTENKEMSVSIC